jgi:hypothetical protein
MVHAVRHSVKLSPREVRLTSESRLSLKVCSRDSIVGNVVCGAAVGFQLGSVCDLLYRSHRTLSGAAGCAGAVQQCRRSVQQCSN